jgi:long-chain fatty acid transport protein
MTSVVAFLLASVALAGHIDYLGGRSADYFMAVARNAATDGADLVTYNPAGLVHLDEGFHLNASTQYIFKDYTITAVPLGSGESTEFGTTKPTPFLPNMYAVYRTGDIAAFGAFTVPAGGGTLDYTDGLPIMPVLQTALVQAQYGQGHIAVMTDGALKAGAAYYAGTLGAAYAITPALSASLAGRYTAGMRDYEGSGDFAIIRLDSMIVVGTTQAALECTRRASGFAGILSLSYMPSPSVNVAVRFETATPLEWEAETEVNSWAPLLPELADGALQRRDLPAILGLGMQFDVNPSLTLGVSGNVYFTGAADQGEDDGIHDEYQDGWEAGASALWQVSPRVQLGMGYIYADHGGGSETFTDFEYMLNSAMLGGGVRYSVTEKLGFVFSAAHAFLKDGEGTGLFAGHEYAKSVSFLTVGVSAGF